MMSLEKIMNGKKNIRNPTEKEILELFPLEEFPFINLNEYCCVCIGTKDGEKIAQKLKVIKCEQIPLNGFHIVEFQGKEIPVTSLTAFKRNVLNCTDCTSFDRSTFLIGKNDKMIRLSQIRDRIRLPIIPPPKIDKIHLNLPHTLSQIGDILINTYHKTNPGNGLIKDHVKIFQEGIKELPNIFQTRINQYYQIQEETTTQSEIDFFEIWEDLELLKRIQDFASDEKY